MEFPLYVSHSLLNHEQCSLLAVELEKAKGLEKVAVEEEEVHCELSTWR